MGSRPQADTQGFQWKLRRMVDNIIHFATVRTTKVYPKTTGALQSLREAVREEMPLKRRRTRIAPDNPGSRKRKSPDMLTVVTSKRHYQKIRRVEKINAQLLIKIASHTAAKATHTKHNFIAPDWLVRVFCRRRAPTPADWRNRSGKWWAWTLLPYREEACPESGTYGLRCTYPWSSRLLLIGWWRLWQVRYAHVRTSSRFMAYTSRTKRP